MKLRKAKLESRLDITGMLFVRDACAATGNLPSHMSSRHLVVVAGILAVPKDADLPGKHQFVVTGLDAPDTLHKEPRIDRTMEALGAGIGNLLLQPIWRT
jgi:hypothetical protein